jgi:hypothetical protein
MRKVAMFITLALASWDGTANAATITHDYEFNGSAVTDSIGGVNGTLYGNASVGGGYLHLDGSGDYVELGAIIPSSTTDFSLFFSFINHAAQPGTYTEVVSQDGGSFYVGSDPSGNIRVTDAYTNTGVVFPSDGNAHAFLLTNSNALSQLFIDGASVWSTAGPIASNPQIGSVARFGRQYGPHAEYFQGDIDAIRVFSGVATFAEASRSSISSAAPEPASWVMMLGGFGMLGATMRRRKASVSFA